uniref:Aminomethyltransferase n=1 Tax=Opalina sp. OP10 TaxID=2666322 RepID=A0A649UZ09_9STRA|nr:aminomethyltransferase [Opalina sp. OP10]
MVHNNPAVIGSILSFISIPEKDAYKLTKELINRGAVPCGLGCRDSLRLEAGLCLYGIDMNDKIDPITAGLLWTIGKSRRVNGGFLGYSEVMRMKDNWTQKRVGFISQGPPARHGAKIFNTNEEEIGYVTSGTMSPILKKPISMGYINKGYHTNDTDVLFEVRGKKYPGKVSKMPFSTL